MKTENFSLGERVGFFSNKEENERVSRPWWSLVL